MTESQIRPFAAFLQELNGGETHDEMSSALVELAERAGAPQPASRDRRREDLEAENVALREQLAQLRSSLRRAIDDPDIAHVQAYLRTILDETPDPGR